jgi:hypothetical protein
MDVILQIITSIHPLKPHDSSEFISEIKQIEFVVLEWFERIKSSNLASMHMILNKGNEQIKLYNTLNRFDFQNGYRTMILINCSIYELKNNMHLGYNFQKNLDFLKQKIIELNKFYMSCMKINTTISRLADDFVSGFVVVAEVDDFVVVDDVVAVAVAVDDVVAVAVAAAVGEYSYYDAKTDTYHGVL